jgi:hypothetical protein
VWMPWRPAHSRFFSCHGGSLFPNGFAR